MLPVNSSDIAYNSYIFQYDNDNGSKRQHRASYNGDNDFVFNYDWRRKNDNTETTYN